MLQSAFQQIGNDFHIAMRMHGKAVSGLHPILIDDSEGAESHVAGVVILIEGETVAGVQPPMIGATPFFTATNRNHQNPRCND